MSTPETQAGSRPASRDGASDAITPQHTVARVMLRPLGSSLPLGAFALVPSSLILSGTQLGWFPMSEMQSAALVILCFSFPLQLVASILAFLGRDALVGTSFGIFSGIWLAYGLSTLIGPMNPTSKVLGVFFLAIAALFVMLVAGGVVSGKLAVGSVIIAGAARFGLTGLYMLTEAGGLETAAGIVGLVFTGVALYVGLATLLEDGAHRSILPLGRRGRARGALESDLRAQINQLEHEAGVRDQL